MTGTSTIKAPDGDAWLVMSYKIPSEPGRHRMAIWRKLKALGAVYLHNGVCLLPLSPDHLRQIKMLAHEIDGMGGEAVMLEATPLDAAQRELVESRFRADRDDAYREFIERCDAFEEEIRRETAAGNLTYAELEENDEDLKKLKTWHTKITAIDFYVASLGEETRLRLAKCEALLEHFASQVFDAHTVQNRQGDEAGA